jgi:DNA-binding NarL/FixJ family response regulator
MVQAARGDVEAAAQSAQPFERARTQLLLGQLTRRERSRSTVVLRDALAVFEQLGMKLWADRARAELAGPHTKTQAGQQDVLTATELRVAELAASGMTNRDVAAKLFISSKTVEATLARVYRKLGIGSRAELGQRLGKGAT